MHINKTDVFQHLNQLIGLNKVETGIGCDFAIDIKIFSDRSTFKGVIIAVYLEVV